MTNIRTYSELIKLPTFEERFEYLRLDGKIAEETFGFDRYLNQKFYRENYLWREVRDQVIVRDMGCDLGVEGELICGPITVHHMNPLQKEDILNQTEYLLSPEYLICTSRNTHHAIHYNAAALCIREPFVERQPNDMCPWRT